MISQRQCVKSLLLEHYLCLILVVSRFQLHNNWNISSHGLGEASQSVLNVVQSDPGLLERIFCPVLRFDTLLFSFNSIPFVISADSESPWPNGNMQYLRVTGLGFEPHQYFTSLSQGTAVLIRPKLLKGTQSPIPSITYQQIQAAHNH